jgi:hypothetical protein
MFDAPTLGGAHDLVIVISEADVAVDRMTEDELRLYENSPIHLMHPTVRHVMGQRMRRLAEREPARDGVAPFDQFRTARAAVKGRIVREDEREQTLIGHIDSVAVERLELLNFDDFLAVDACTHLGSPPTSPELPSTRLPKGWP